MKPMTSPYNMLFENPRMKLYRNMNLKAMQSADVSNLLKAAITLLTLAPRGHAVYVVGSSNVYTITLYPATRRLHSQSTVIAVSENDEVLSGPVDEIVSGVSRTIGQISNLGMTNLVSNDNYLLYTDGKRQMQHRTINFNNNNMRNKRSRT